MMDEILTNRVVKNIVAFSKTHRLVSVGFALLMAGASWWAYSSLFSAGAATRYVAGKVERGTVIVSVSASGQVSALNQLDIKAKASGDIIYLARKNGDFIGAGGVIASIDARNAEKAVRDAEIALDRAKIELEKMKGLQTDSGVLRGIKQKSEDDLAKAYDDGFNTVSNAFLNLPNVMSGLNDILLGTSVAGSAQGQWNMDFYSDAAKKYDENASVYRDNAYNSYQKARGLYDSNFSLYKNTTRYSSGENVEALILETYDTTKSVAEAIKNSINLIQFYKDKLTEHGLKVNPIADTQISQLNNYTGTTNSYLLSLLSIKNSIETSKEALASVGFDITDQEINVKQAASSLQEAKDKLTDYTIRAPFPGVLAKINVKIGDSISVNTVAATLITRQRLAEISLNEVDVAKIKIGQKVNITFDAIENLNIAGMITEIDSIGTITQGVVNYGVKIGFDTQDDRVKPGMSVSAVIITDVKQNVLFVPNSAVKEQNGTAYVEMYVSENGVPREQAVRIGLANDTITEIVSGVNNGNQVVIQTITAAAQTATQQQSTGIRIPGLTGGGR
jgi:HlyD family secretion protein